jgi:polyferredoxin
LWGISPIRELLNDFALASLGLETFDFFYGFATYGNAGFMREQVKACPHARFQSAMFDKDTLIVTYDQQR